MALLAFIFRLVVVLFILRLAGIVLRAFVGGFAQGSSPPAAPENRGAGWGASPPTRGQIEELVKDPVCGVHTARSSAIVGRYQGATAYFCSEDCAARASAGGP